MTRTGCKQLCALVPGNDVAWKYAEKSVSLNSKGHNIYNATILCYIHVLYTESGTTEYYEISLSNFGQSPYSLKGNTYHYRLGLYFHQMLCVPIGTLILSTGFL